MNMKIRRGFSLIEFLVTLSIIGVLSTIGAGIFRTVQRHTALRSATGEIIESIRTARERTLASLNDSRHGVHFDQYQWVIFEGDNYDPSDSDNEIYPLSPSVEIAEINLGALPEVLFSTVNSALSQSRTFQVRLRDEPGVAEIIRVLNTGQVGLSEDLVAPTSRIIDSRHVHYDLNWSIKGYDYLKIVFHEELQPDVVIPSIAMAPYFTVSPDAFAWEGELAAYGETQRLSINTHLLDDFDTLLSVHRDQRYNTKGVTISVEEGGVTKEIVTYAEGGDINEVSGVEATIQ